MTPPITPLRSSGYLSTIYPHTPTLWSTPWTLNYKALLSPLSLSTFMRAFFFPSNPQFQTIISLQCHRRGKMPRQRSARLSPLLSPQNGDWTAHLLFRSKSMSQTLSSSTSLRKSWRLLRATLIKSSGKLRQGRGALKKSRVLSVTGQHLHTNW